MEFLVSLTFLRDAVIPFASLSLVERLDRKVKCCSPTN